ARGSLREDEGRAQDGRRSGRHERGWCGLSAPALRRGRRRLAGVGRHRAPSTTPPTRDRLQECAWRAPPACGPLRPETQPQHSPRSLCLRQASGGDASRAQGGVSEQLSVTDGRTVMRNRLAFLVVMVALLEAIATPALAWVAAGGYHGAVAVGGNRCCYH